MIKIEAKIKDIILIENKPASIEIRLMDFNPMNKFSTDDIKEIIKLVDDTIRVNHKVNPSKIITVDDLETRKKTYSTIDSEYGYIANSLNYQIIKHKKDLGKYSKFEDRQLGLYIIINKAIDDKYFINTIGVKPLSKGFKYNMTIEQLKKIVIT